MRAILHAANAPLRLTDAPQPAPGAREILISVAAAGVNRPDLLQRAGFYPPPPGAPETLGLEIAGEVVGAGAEVRRWRAGDKVCALLPGGGYADYAVADEGSALPVPGGLSIVEAAALPETAFTVWANVFETGGLKAGEAFLAHGGASGIGTTAIQMAAAAGATVYATAGSAAKVALCEKLGAARAINYREEDFAAVLQELGGVDVILDMVGGDYTAKNLAILKEFGRLVIIAFLRGPKAEADLSLIMRKRLTITGSTLRSRSIAEKARLAGEVEKHVWPWIAAGKVKPVIDSTFPLERAEEAHARMQANAHAGKIVLTMSAIGAAA